MSFSISSLSLLYIGPLIFFERYADREPNDGEIDILLSFTTTMRSVSKYPALSNPSYAIPLDREPSPIIATTFSVVFAKSRPIAIPSAADIDVPACPTLNVSYSLSSLLGNPLKPPYCLKVWNWSLLPVIILWAYVWCPTSQTSLSFGVSNT